MSEIPARVLFFMPQTYPLIRPYIKPRGFCPNPVVVYGIPSYADSAANPKVVGTPAWKEYWTEQLYYVVNGYYTAGEYIPGRYYYYLNFCKTSSVKSGEAFYPGYVDFQYEFFLLIEEAKRIGKNVVGPKGRRKGVTIMEIGGVIDYGYRFFPGYHGGVGAGSSDYTDEFMAKWEFVNARMVNEFKVRTLSRGEEIIAGWEQKDEVGSWNVYGTQNMIYSKTMFADPEAFKGKYFNDIVFEESGEFDHLIKAYQASKQCVMSGDEQVGTIYFLGTGGNIKTGSSGFEQVWHNYEDFNALRYFISGTKFYMPCVAGSRNKYGEINEDIPNFSHLTPEERYGMEDEVRAEELINARKAELLKNPDLTMYWEECKDNPTDIKEVFRRAASNNFPIEILNNQSFEINDLAVPKYDKYKLEFKKDGKGNYLMPYEVEAEPLPEDSMEDCYIMILHGGMPMADIQNLDVSGIDSYDMDQSMTTKSLGAMLIYRRKHSIEGVEKNLPIAIIRCRPKRKEMFYDLCMKASIFWKLYRCTLIDAAKPAIIKHYLDNGCEMYLAFRPKKYESPNSEQRHTYGMLVPNPAIVHSLLQTDMMNNGHKIWFPLVIDEALSFDDKARYSDSDKDLIDAYGLALAMDGAFELGVRDDTDNEIEKAFEMPSSYFDEEGNVRMGGSNDEDFSLDYHHA